MVRCEYVCKSLGECSANDCCCVAYVLPRCGYFVSQFFGYVDGVRDGVFESDIIIAGCPGGIISCAMMIARSSAMLVHVSVVPMVCGSACMCVSSGTVVYVCHGCVV